MASQRFKVPVCKKSLSAIDCSECDERSSLYTLVAVIFLAKLVAVAVIVCLIKFL